MPFHGGFGLLNIHGIAKPAYRAYQLMHGLGDTLLPMHYSHPTVDAWLSQRPGEAVVMLTNFALPRHPISSETVAISLANAGLVKSVSVERIDIDHANAKRHWEQIGKPEYLDAETLAVLNAASELVVEDVKFDIVAGAANFELTLLPQSVAAVRLHY